MTILDEIFANKRLELAGTMRDLPLKAVRGMAETAPQARDFVGGLLRAESTPALIAEVKFASPSRGTLRTNRDPVSLAKIYLEAGAAAVSVLTEKRYFHGSLDFLAEIRNTFDAQGRGLPLLRKDFIFDAYQVYEARAAGADALLLIVAMLETEVLRELYQLTVECGMTPLVEVHDREELEKALALNPSLLGINNRNLGNFQVSLDTTLDLRAHVPAEICLVAESGIHTREDARRLADAGVRAVLVGEALVTAEDPAAKIRSLIG